MPVDRLRRNAALGLAGLVIPTGIILISYRLLLHGLGDSKFGVFALATAMSGVLAAFDAGIGAATLRHVALANASGEHENIPRIVRTSLWFYLAVGSCVSALIWTFAPTIASAVRIPAELQSTAVTAFRWSAIQATLAAIAAVPIFALKGLQEFLSAMMLTAAAALASPGVAGVAVALFGADLDAAVIAGVVATGALVIGAWFVCARVLSRLRMSLGAGEYDTGILRMLASFGSVMMTNGIVGVLVNQLPKLLVGVVFGPASVAGYAVASSAASRIHAVAAAPSESLFPYISGLTSPRTLRRAYVRTLGWSIVLAGSVTLAVVIFAWTLLKIWVGDSMATQAEGLLRIFAGAYFALALSGAPYFLANGVGRPKWNTVFVFGHFALFLAATGALLLVWRKPEAVAYGFLTAGVVSVAGYLLWVEHYFITLARQELVPIHDSASVESPVVEGLAS